MTRSAHEPLKVSILLFWIVTCFAMAVANGSEGEDSALLRRASSGKRFPVPVEEGSVPLANEPDYKGAPYRAMIPVDKARGVVIPIVIDPKGSIPHLYADGNGNGDLTDDKLIPGTQEWGWGDIIFRDVPIVRTVDGVPVHYRLDVTYYGAGDGAGACVTSCWSGQAELAGAPWVVRVVDNLDGVIDENDQLMLVKERVNLPDDHTGQMLAVPPSGRVCVDGRVYETSYAFEAASRGEAGLRVHFQPVDVPLGTLHIAGENITWLRITGGNIPVVLNAPRGSVEVPVSSYTSQSLAIKDHRLGACMAEADVTFEVTEAQPATLELGGPLTAGMDVTRSGRVITLFPTAVGIGGETYSAGGTAVTPESAAFTIYKGDKVLVSDDFQYG